jgi:hypothetical protein
MTEHQWKDQLIGNPAKEFHQIVCAKCGLWKRYYQGQPCNESHESAVDEIKRYRDEYAEQGNEEALNESGS